MAPRRPVSPLLRAMMVAALPLLAAGCVNQSAGTSTVQSGSRPDTSRELGNLTYRAIDRLISEVPDLQLGKQVVVGSIVNVQHVDQSVPFGNLVADLARSRLVQKGVDVSEMRLRSAVLLDRKQGALMLANDRTAVVPPPSASAILTGTYAASDDWVYVSLKLIAVADARIVGAVDFAVPRRGSEMLLTPAS